MKIMIDLDPRTIWRIDTIAEQLGVTAGEVIRAQLEQRLTTLPFAHKVRSRVLAGMCDADIAAELGATNNTIAAIRRAEKLPANRRNQKRKTA